MQTHSYTFRIPDDVRYKLEILAKKDGRTLSNLIIKILTDYISSHPVTKEG